MRYLTMLLSVVLMACSGPTAPSNARVPQSPSLDVGGSTAPADKGSCNPNDPDTSPGNLKHCSPGHAPGNSNSPGNS